MSGSFAKVSLAFTGAMLILTLVAGPSFASGGREMPSRAISPDSTCWAATVNNHDGYECQEPGSPALFFCTTPRTVCWPIIPPGPYHRGTTIHIPPLAPPQTSPQPTTTSIPKRLQR